MTLIGTLIIEEEVELEMVIHFIWRIAGGCVSWFVWCFDGAEHLESSGNAHCGVHCY